MLTLAVEIHIKDNKVSLHGERGKDIGSDACTAWLYVCVTEIWSVDVLVTENDPFRASHIPFDYLAGTVLGCGGYDVRVQSLPLGIWLFTWRGSRLIAKRGILSIGNCSAKLISFSYWIILLTISWNLTVYQVCKKENPSVNHFSSYLRNICWMNILHKTRFLQTDVQKNLLYYLLWAFSSWKGYFTFFFFNWNFQEVSLS